MAEAPPILMISLDHPQKRTKPKCECADKRSGMLQESRITGSLFKILRTRAGDCGPYGTTKNSDHERGCELVIAPLADAFRFGIYQSGRAAAQTRRDLAIRRKHSGVKLSEYAAG